MARTLPTLGISPIDVYRDKMARPMGYFEGVADITGTVPGVYTLVKNDAARTAGTLKGFSFNVEPLAAVDAYAVVGGEVCTYLASTVITTGAVHGLFVETQGGATIGGDFYSLYVYSAPSCTPSGDSAVVRLESNVTTDARQTSWITFVGTKGLRAMDFGPTDATTAWHKDTTVSVQAGRIKVRVGSSDRYIALYSS